MQHPNFEELSSLNADRIKKNKNKETIKKILKGLESDPRVRAAKIASLKKAIKEGTYNPDYDKVAEKLLREHLLNELL